MLISYSYVYIQNLESYGSHIRYIRDETFTNMLASDIIDESDSTSPDKPIVILGSHPALPSDQVSKSLSKGSLYGFDYDTNKISKLYEYI